MGCGEEGVSYERTASRGHEGAGAAGKDEVFWKGVGWDESAALGETDEITQIWINALSAPM